VEIRRRSWRGTFVAGGVLTLAVALTSGCGGSAEPERIGATGIDELTIPTPDPRAADFVAEIDNPFLPFPPGAVWVYESNRGTTLTVTATTDTKMIQGVRTTVVNEETRDVHGEVVGFASRWLAQDQRGNVWNFGLGAAEGGWEAGVGGARAGLAMAAVPRVGDGYRQGLLSGVAEDKATVVALDGEERVPAGDFDGLVVTEQTSDLRPGASDEHRYAKGVGLILWEFSGSGQAELVSHTMPAP
jgi:hypothetical protein